MDVNYRKLGDVNQRIEWITESLFFHQKDNSWYGFFLGLFKGIAKYFIRSDVEKALSAYKFDLLGKKITPKQRNLFTEREKQYIDPSTGKILGIFQYKLEQRPVATAAEKAKRWEKKCKKYDGKQGLLAAKAAYQLAKEKLGHHPKTLRALRTILFTHERSPKMALIAFNIWASTIIKNKDHKIVVDGLMEVISDKNGFKIPTASEVSDWWNDLISQFQS